ncbi:MAG TPA: acetyl-CoA C-acetyltransferase [Porticoccaceae bacterium]|nr:acetyl-CoA C-acetyltransferase [Porticoccaceae bacterium]
MAEAYIVGALRTATGKNRGRLSHIHPVDLGAMLVDGLVDQVGVAPESVDDLVFGCVSQSSEQAGNVARNVALASKLGESVPGVSVDRQCGSAQQAIHFAAQAVMSGTQDLVIAGGVESMSRVPMFSNVEDGADKGRGEPKSDRLEERYPGVEFSQFSGAEMLAKKYEISREELDNFGYQSHMRATVATESGRFREEILPLHLTLENGDIFVHDADEGIRPNASLEAISELEPLAPGGVITAGTASQISDGAAAIMVANEEAVKKYGLKPRARFHSLAVVGSDPVIMLEGPIPATKKVLERVGLEIGDIDLYEVNEAFGSVPLAWAKAVGADLDKLNVNGGAQANGHPLGCTGAKLMTTLLHELERRNGRYGLLAICEGGGTANATIIERLDS